MRRVVLLCALVLLCLLPLSAQAQDTSRGLVIFDPDETYLVPGATLNALSAAFATCLETSTGSSQLAIEALKPLAQVSDSFKEFRTRVLWTELALGTALCLSTGTAVYFAGHYAGWW